jgi:hypothetical protein
MKKNERKKGHERKREGMHKGEEKEYVGENV